MQRVLAVPSLGAEGGGIGQVSSLLWEVFEELWPEDGRLVPLLHHAQLAPGYADKVRFGLSVAHAQLLAHARWILFTHLGLARVQHWLPERHRSPYAVFLHGVEAWKPLPARDRDLLRGAALRLANSTFTARRVMDANPDIGPVVPCPLTLPGAAASADAVDRAAATSSTVLIVGRMSATERYKGHDELIDAWPIVVAQAPEAVLVIAGDGDDRPRLEARARASAAAAHIRFEGFVSRDDLARLYEEAAVFAMPSRGEGFGLVYLEAMAHGLPCVGSTEDAAGEVIVDGDTGFLVDLNASDQLAAVIVRLLRDGGLRRRLGDAGRARLRSHFTTGQFRQRLAGLLQERLDPSGPAAS
jgi:phosphatidylinositol alpha-1,6-mannosyltransferase